MKPLVYKKAKRVRQPAPVRMKLHITKGDTVQVISGDDKGKRGQVLRVHPKTGRVTIEGVNMVKRHRRATQTDRGRDRRVREAPIHHSKAMLLDPKSGEPTRVRRRRGRRRDGGADRREVGSVDPEEPVTMAETPRTKAPKPEKAAQEAARRRARGKGKEKGAGRRGGPRAQGRRGHAAAAGVLRADGARQARRRTSGSPTRTRCRGWRRSCSTSAWATRARTRSSSRPRSRSWG